MKKLKFDDSDVAVVVKDATCNYCGEDNDVCFEIVVPFQYQGVGQQKLVEICDNLSFGFLGDRKRYMYEASYEETTNIHVCINCVKQMAQYKPKKKSNGNR